MGLTGRVGVVGGLLLPVLLGEESNFCASSLYLGEFSIEARFRVREVEEIDLCFKNN